MLQNLKQFFSAEAFEQRGRDRERRKLVAELEALDEARRYISGRTGPLLSRMNVLNHEDCAATLSAIRSASGKGAHTSSDASAKYHPTESFALHPQRFGRANRGVDTSAAVWAKAEFARLNAWRERVLAAFAIVACLCAWQAW